MTYRRATLDESTVCSIERALVNTSFAEVGKAQVEAQSETFAIAEVLSRFNF